jgi:hypothetical protein
MEDIGKQQREAAAHSRFLVSPGILCAHLSKSITCLLFLIFKVLVLPVAHIGIPSVAVENGRP